MKALGQVVAASIFILAYCCQVSAQRKPLDTDWPNYGNDLAGRHYQDIGQITPGNISNLRPAWIFHTNVVGEHTSFEAQPIVENGVVYISSPHDHVFAIDAATGALKWTYTPHMPPLAKLAICCGQTNRGVAYGDGKVFIARLDAALVALDGNTGKEVWKTQVLPWQQKWTETMAPLYVDGKVIIGGSGGEFKVRGNISAYDAKTGKQLWRFYTVPGPGEFGHKTWAGDSWKTGGATVWSTPVADTKLGLLYIVTGNAAPDMNGSTRAGDNLFTSSIVALDLNTGKYKWHFQEVHHDLWDYDAVQPPQLFTITRDGQRIPAIGHANKDGFYFILDRRNGKPIFPVKEVAVPAGPEWQHAAKTQPEPATDPLIPHQVASTPAGMRSAPFWTPPQPQPTLIQPGWESGPEWSPSAYSPQTHYAYIEAGGYEPWRYHAVQTELNTPGSTAWGTEPHVQQYGLVDALNVDTGKLAWKYKVPYKVVSGIAVAGDLVFFGETQGKFDALDARTGKLLWAYNTKGKGIGGANGSPAVYAENGREFIVMAFGGNGKERVDGQPSPRGDALIAFALPGKSDPKPNVVYAHPGKVHKGGIPDSRKVSAAKQAPSGVKVIELKTHDFSFFPDEFTVSPGEKIALHIVNDGVPSAGFGMKVPSGPEGLKKPIKPGHGAFFIFTAPIKPGDYKFFDANGPMKFFSPPGHMKVEAKTSAKK